MISTRPISAAQQSWLMISWKRCTQYTFNYSYSSSHGEYLLENRVTHFDGNLFPYLDRLFSTLVVFPLCDAQPTLSGTSYHLPMTSWKLFLQGTCRALQSYYIWESNTPLYYSYITLYQLICTAHNQHITRYIHSMQLRWASLMDGSTHLDHISLYCNPLHLFFLLSVSWILRQNFSILIIPS